MHQRMTVSIGCNGLQRLLPLCSVLPTLNHKIIQMLHSRTLSAAVPTKSAIILCRCFHPGSLCRTLRKGSCTHCDHATSARWSGHAADCCSCDPIIAQPHLKPYCTLILSCSCGGYHCLSPSEAAPAASAGIGVSAGICRKPSRNQAMPPPWWRGAGPGLGRRHLPETEPSPRDAASVSAAAGAGAAARREPAGHVEDVRQVRAHVSRLRQRLDQRQHLRGDN